MIYTVTFNPALDYIVRLDSFAAGGINRVNYEQVLGGGKGINVSIVLVNMGIKSTALGFIAGFTGEEIKRQLITQNVDFDFVQLPEGFTRINVKVKADVETEINGQGPISARQSSRSSLTSSTSCRKATRSFWQAPFPTPFRTTSTSASWDVCRARASASSWMPRKSS